MTMPDHCQIRPALPQYSLAISSSNQEKYNLEEGGLLRSKVIEIYVRKTDNCRIPGASTICIWTSDRQRRQMSETMKRSRKSEMHNKEKTIHRKRKIWTSKNKGEMAVEDTS